MKHIPRKRFGQHFLQDHTVIAQLIDVISPFPSEHLLEIGPGLGALTVALLPYLNQLDVIEIDHDIIPLLEVNCRHTSKLTIHNTDALRFHLKDLGKFPIRIVGNLPYNISTPLIFHFLQQLHLIQDMHFMLQKEVVDRIVALPGQADYGRLSIMVQYYCQAEKLFDVSPIAFYPPPQVNSSIIRIKPHSKPPYIAQDPQLLATIVRDAFSQRRKTLRNSLKAWLTEADFIALKIDPTHRPEQLSVKSYVEITNMLLFSKKLRGRDH